MFKICFKPFVPLLFLFSSLYFSIQQNSNLHETILLLRSDVRLCPIPSHLETRDLE